MLTIRNLYAGDCSEFAAAAFAELAAPHPNFDVQIQSPFVGLNKAGSVDQMKLL